MQQVDDAGTRHDVPEAQQAEPHDADWLQQCPALHAACVGHTWRGHSKSASKSPSAASQYGCNRVATGRRQAEDMRRTSRDG